MSKPKPQSKNVNQYRTPNDPTPEEIAIRCQEIQGGWDEQTRLMRQFGAGAIREIAKSQTWSPPEVKGVGIDEAADKSNGFDNGAPREET